MDGPVSGLSYLSLITHPEQGGAEGSYRALLGAGVLDGQTLRLRLTLPAPVILGLMPRDAALRGTEALRAAGADSFICTRTEIEALGPTLKIRDLRVENGRFAIDLWRGGSETLPFEDIRFIIRASLVRQHARANPAASSTGESIGFAVAAPELAIARSAVMPTEPERIRSISTSEKLDLHATDGRVLQIDGDKFGWSALGSLKGHSDKANMDRMLELLRHFDHRAIVDEFFGMWKPPPDIRRFRIPQMTINGDDPAFAFYSRWAALMYRHITGRG